MTRLVVDTNCVLSAILKDGETRRAMMESDAVLFAPRFLRIEVERHKVEIVRRTHGSVADVDRMLAVLYRRISWVGDDELAPLMAAAAKVMDEIDPADAPFIACALAVKADAIWSHDTDFDRQSLVRRVAHPDEK